MRKRLLKAIVQDSNLFLGNKRSRSIDHGHVPNMKKRKGTFLDKSEILKGIMIKNP